MGTSVGGNLDYGNWVSRKFVYVPGALALAFLALSILVPPLAVGAALSLAALAYFAYARRAFSAGGGNVQARIWGAVLDRLDWDGRGSLLDIGCGNAPLVIEAAKRYPTARVVGIDYWGGAWEYSARACRLNAERAGVADRVEFQKASAAALPFADESFDAAISNLVFHEVQDVADKREVVREALRVVRKGGVFAFQDLFIERRLYGDVDDLLATIRGWGVESVAFADTRESCAIPRALRLPFMVGRIGVISGRK